MFFIYRNEDFNIKSESNNYNVLLPPASAASGGHTLREVVAMAQLWVRVRISSPLGPRKKFRKAKFLKIKFPTTFLF